MQVNFKHHIFSIAAFIIFLFSFNSVGATENRIKFKMDLMIGPGSGWHVNDELAQWERCAFAEGALGAYFQFPLSQKLPLYIETGLAIGIKRAQAEIHDYDDFYWGYGYNPATFRIPVKLGYKLNLSQSNSLHIAFGPYIGWFGSLPEFGGFKSTQIGLTPSIMFQHKKFNVGITYITPCFYNGPKDLNKNTILFNIGFCCDFNPKSKGWKSAGIGLAALAVGVGSAAAAYNNTVSKRSNQISYTETTSTSEPNVSAIEPNVGSANQPYEQSYQASSSKRKKSTSTKNKKEDNWNEVDELAQYQKFNKVYLKYRDQMSDIYAWPDKRQIDFGYEYWTECQKKMKKEREQWNAKARKYKIKKIDMETKPYPFVLSKTQKERGR